MKKLIPCMLAGLIITGLFALCISSFLAPSANYIKDTLDPPEEPFYITLHPQSVLGSYPMSVVLVCQANLQNCTYSWESRTYNSSWRPVSSGIAFDGLWYSILYSTSQQYYRCKVTYGDRVIYSAPCFVSATSSGTKSLSIDLNPELEDFEKNSDFEELEKTEVSEESEVID